MDSTDNHENTNSKTLNPRITNCVTILTSCVISQKNNNNVTNNKKTKQKLNYKIRNTNIF